ncbi:MAG: 50S ribosomal protein L30 [Candidatus Bathyarchaeia archaeon]
MGEAGKRCLAIVRIRGNVNIRRELEDIFKDMHLTRENHATLMDNRPSYVGSIRRVKDYATWGDISSETIALLLRKRGRLRGGRMLTEGYVRESLGYGSIEDLAKAIHACEADFWRLPMVKPLFRLHPPKGGFRRKTKWGYPRGELGYRGEAINDLIAKMV